jgi:hypothetical protein
MDETVGARRRPVLRSVLVAALLATSMLVAVGGPASADPYMTLTCSSGGFTGTVRVEYIRQGGGREFIPQVSYRISRGGNSGGNQADVYFNDGGTLPAKNFLTNHGIQDGQWHRLSSGSYYRGDGYTNVTFIFDRSFASDPRCSASQYW